MRVRRPSNAAQIRLAGVFCLSMGREAFSRPIFLLKLPGKLVTASSDQRVRHRLPYFGVNETSVCCVACLTAEGIFMIKRLQGEMSA